MRLFGSEPMKFPPPLLRLQRSAPPHRGGLIDNSCGKKKRGSDAEEGRDERIGNKENKPTSNMWFTYKDLKLPRLFKTVAREGNKITPTIMFNRKEMRSLSQLGEQGVQEI